MKRLVLLGALVAVGCSSPEDVGSQGAAYTTQCADASVVEGVDISSGQSPVNWTSVLGAGRHFAFIKATQGDYYTSSNFATQYAGAKTAGVLRSAYHFFDPTVDGVAQANYFLGVVKTIEPGDLPPMLDVECPDGDSMCLGFAGGSGQAPAATIVQRALDWLTTVEAATGKTPIVYTFPSYFPGLATQDSALAKYPLFIATLASCASVPAPWTTATFWQYSWTGTVNGIPGQVDLDRFFGSLADLQTFASPPMDAGADAAADAARDAPAEAAPGKDAAVDATDEGASPPSSDGCSCDAAGARTHGSIAWLALVVALGVRRRRTKRDRAARFTAGSTPSAESRAKRCRRRSSRRRSRRRSPGPTSSSSSVDQRRAG